MHGEELVVGIGLHQVACWSQQLQTNEQREEASDKEEECDREQVEQCDTLVVGGEQPRTDAVVLVQIIFALHRLHTRGSHTHCT